MKSKFLSVVVPVYKTEKYLAKCLDSIICQTFRDIEIICVNDGSPDNSKEILLRYEQLDPRIVVLETPNGGLSIARNVALDYIFNKSTCAAVFDEHFIAFVDSDDYIDRSTFENALMHFEGDIDAVSFGYECIYSENNFITERKISNYKNLEGLVQVTDDVIINTFPAVWSIIFKADIIRINHIRFPENLRFEDNYFTSLYLLFSRSIFYVNMPLYKYLIRSDSITGTAKVNDYSKDFILIAKSIKSFLETRNLLNSRENYFWLFFYHLVLAALNNCKCKESADQIYKDATYLLNSTDRGISSLIFDHYDKLINKKYFKPTVKYLLCGLLKINHGVLKDKIFFCGLELLSITHSEKGLVVKLFGLRVY